MVKNIVTFLSFLAFTAAIVPAAEAVKPKSTPIKDENRRGENLNFPPSIKKKVGKKKVKRSIARNSGAKIHGANFAERLNQVGRMPQYPIDPSETE